MVAFLTTLVRAPDKDDWGKLKRVLKHLNGTSELKLKLSMDNLDVKGGNREILQKGQVEYNKFD